MSVGTSLKSLLASLKSLLASLKSVGASLMSLLASLMSLLTSLKSVGTSLMSLLASLKSVTIFSLVKYTKRPNPPTPFPAREGGESKPLSASERGMEVRFINQLHAIVKTNLSLSRHRDCWKILIWHISLRHLWYNEVDEVANLHDDGLILRRIRLIATVEHEHQL